MGNDHRDGRVNVPTEIEKGGITATCGEIMKKRRQLLDTYIRIHKPQNNTSWPYFKPCAVLSKDLEERALEGTEYDFWQDKPRAYLRNIPEYQNATFRKGKHLFDFSSQLFSFPFQKKNLCIIQIFLSECLFAPKFPYEIHWAFSTCLELSPCKCVLVKNVNKNVMFYNFMLLFAYSCRLASEKHRGTNLEVQRTEAPLR